MLSVLARKLPRQSHLIHGTHGRKSDALVVRPSKQQRSNGDYQRRNEESSFRNTLSLYQDISKWRLFGAVALGAVIMAFTSSDDTKNDSEEKDSKKKKVVILGSGWAALSILHTLSTELYDIQIVSPRNYFLFTPLLPEATVGTVEPRSIVEPIRRVCKRMKKNAEFFEAECIGVDPKNSTITCKCVSAEEPEFKLKYDKLIVAVGATNNTFNTPGVKENCFFVKEVPDVYSIRSRIMDCFERANTPGKTVEEKKSLLHFVVVGGGPTGVEFAGELHDFLRDDLSRAFPSLVQHCKISLIQSAGVLLNTYDQSISDYVESKFKKRDINVLTNSRVLEVTPKTIKFSDKVSKQIVETPYGLCVWSTGNDAHPLVKHIQEQIKGLERKIEGKPVTVENNKALVTNAFFQVDVPLDTPNLGKIYAVGDCATVKHQMMDRVPDLFARADLNKDGKISLNEFEAFVRTHQRQFPQMVNLAKNMKKFFGDVDVNNDGALDFAEFRTMAQSIDKEIRSLPATAQAASQAGKFLGKHLNDEAAGTTSEPFIYKHTGQFASLGDSDAVIEVFTPVQSFQHFISTGFGAYLMWRAFYWEQQVSSKNRALLVVDWFKSSIFGRDTSRF